MARYIPDGHAVKLPDGRTVYSPEYRAWTAMRSRCLNKKDESYAQYGGRGISIDPRWRDFHYFLYDMGLRPSPIHSLDRINNEAGYAKSNCRWATKQEQANNRRKRAA
jgi:hypothetical protein